MENLGDWLYIVFLIMGGVSMFFSSKKEKKKPTVVLGHPDGRVDAPGKKPLRNTKSAKKKLKNQINNETKPASTFNPMNESGSYLSTYVSPYAKETDVIEDELAETIHLDDPNEARKAFIYSEVFGRKF